MSFHAAEAISSNCHCEAASGMLCKQCLFTPLKQSPPTVLAKWQPERSVSHVFSRRWSNLFVVSTLYHAVVSLFLLFASFSIFFWAESANQWFVLMQKVTKIKTWIFLLILLFFCLDAKEPKNQDLDLFASFLLMFFKGIGEPPMSVCWKIEISSDKIPKLARIHNLFFEWKILPAPQTLGIFTCCLLRMWDGRNFNFYWHKNLRSQL